jgi:hypothetical protein
MGENRSYNDQRSGDGKFSMELRIQKASDTTLSTIKYQKSRPDKKLVRIAQAIGNRECFMLWVLFALVIVVGVALAIVSIQATGMDTFLNTKVAGRSGGTTVLWMILVLMAGGGVGFLIAIWFARVKMRNHCEEMWEALPKATELPAKATFHEDDGKFQFALSLSIETATVKVQDSRWYILNSAKDIAKKACDPETIAWLKQESSSNEAREGKVLVDSDGGPCCFITEEHVLWLFSNQFLKTVEVPEHPNLMAEATEAKSKIRHVLRSLPY